MYAHRTFDAICFLPGSNVYARSAYSSVATHTQPTLRTDADECFKL